MEVEYSRVEQPEDDDQVNDCTSFHKLPDNVRLYSSMFTFHSLRDLDIEDRKMLAMIIGFCSTNFAQRHHNVRALLSTHKVTHCGEVFVTYVISMYLPPECTFSFVKQTALKELRSSRIVDMDTGPAELFSKKTGLRTQHSLIKVTAHSMLNEMELESVSVTRIQFNHAVPSTRSISNDLPSESGIMKRARRST
jgi:hypothetical protein